MPDAELDQKTPKKQPKGLEKYKWYLLGGLGLIAAVVFFLVNRNNSTPSSSATSTGCTDTSGNPIPCSDIGGGNFSSLGGGEGTPGATGPAGPAGPRGPRGKPGKGGKGGKGKHDHDNSSGRGASWDVYFTSPRMRVPRLNSSPAAMVYPGQRPITWVKPGQNYGQQTGG